MGKPFASHVVSSDSSVPVTKGQVPNIETLLYVKNATAVSFQIIQHHCGTQFLGSVVLEEVIVAHLTFRNLASYT